MTDQEAIDRIYDSVSGRLTEGDIISFCELSLDPSDMRELRSFIPELLAQIEKEPNEKNDLLLSVILVDIAFNDYNEGDYWSTFWKVAGSNRSFNLKTMMNELLVRTLERYGLPINEEEYNGPYRDTNRILMQCFVPKAYAWGLFDYAADIYNHWGHCIPDDYQKEFDQIAEQFSISLNQTDIDSEVFTGGYHFPKPARRVMSDTVTFGKMFMNILKCLDDNHRGRDLGSLTDTFDDWLYDSYLRRTTQTLATFRYDYKKDELTAVIPRQAIGGVHDSTISINGESYVQKDYYYNCGSINEFRAHKVILCKYGVKLFDRFILLLNDRDVTPSGNFNRYIIFDRAWIQIGKPTEGINYILRRPDVVVSAERSYVFHETEEYCIDAICSENGDMITVDSDSYIVKDDLSSDIAITVPLDGMMCRSVDRGYTIPVYTETPEIEKDPDIGETIVDILEKGSDIKICRLHLRNDHEHVGMRYILFPDLTIPSDEGNISFDIDGERFDITFQDDRIEYDIGKGRTDSNAVFFTELKDKVRIFPPMDLFLLAEGNGRSKYYAPTDGYDLSDFVEYIQSNLNATYSVSVMHKGGNLKLFDVETTGDYVCEEGIDTVKIHCQSPMTTADLFCEIDDSKETQSFIVTSEPVAIDVSKGCSMKLFVKPHDRTNGLIDVYERTFNVITTMTGETFRVRMRPDNLPYDAFFNIKVDGMPVSLGAEIFKPMYYNSIPYDSEYILEHARNRLVPLQKFNLDLRMEHIDRAAVAIQKEIIEAECNIRDTKILFLLARKFEKSRPDWTIKLLDAIIKKDPRNSEAKYLRSYLVKK